MPSSARRSVWTAANVVTCLRVALVPLWLVAAELAQPAQAFRPSQPLGDGPSATSLLVAVFFVLLALSDKLDGYLARSRGEVTTFGKFLDPIADKLVVIVALLYLLEQGVVPSWAILLVVAREFLVSGLRMVVASQGTVIAASRLGKWKTATTMCSLAGFLLVLGVPASEASAILLCVSNVAFVVAIALTAWSGVDYFVKSRKFLVGGGAEDE